MNQPDWKTVELDKGVLREPVAEADRLVFWLQVSEGTDRLWERVSSTSRSPVLAEQGLCAVAASGIRARPRTGGLFRKLLGRSAGGHVWLLPTGESVEQVGGRETNLLLAWSADEAAPLNEADLRARWPDSRRVCRVGKNLYLVAGVEPPGSETASPEEDPRAVAEKRLAAARRTGREPAIAAALTDVGAVLIHDGKAAEAAPFLEEALTLVRASGDRSRQSDVLNNLALAVTAGGDVQRGLALLNEALATAREAGDRFAEKTALNDLGLAYAGLGNPARGLELLGEALTIARAVGDKKHEAELIWEQGVRHAEMGRADVAMTHAQAAVDLMRELGRPEAMTYSEHLLRYHLDSPPSAAAAGGAVVVGTWTTASAPNVKNPGLLRMASSVARSMARFVGSGMKTVSPGVRAERLATCSVCEHHTGLRCRLCGCFTAAKAMMPHERCPIGKWPAR
jgi:tetratricopeptide (TPR) repeat protein